MNRLHMNWKWDPVMTGVSFVSPQDEIWPTQPYLATPHTSPPQARAATRPPRSLEWFLVSHVAASDSHRGLLMSVTLIFRMLTHSENMRLHTSQHMMPVLFLWCLDQHVTLTHYTNNNHSLEKLEKPHEVKRDFRVNKNCKQVEVMLLVFWTRFNGKMYVVKRKKHEQRRLLVLSGPPFLRSIFLYASLFLVCGPSVSSQPAFWLDNVLF